MPIEVSNGSIKCISYLIVKYDLELSDVLLLLLKQTKYSEISTMLINDFKSCKW